MNSLMDVPERTPGTEVLSGMPLRPASSSSEAAVAVPRDGEPTTGCRQLYAQSAVQAGQETIGSLAENQSTSH